MPFLLVFVNFYSAKISLINNEDAHCPEQRAIKINTLYLLVLPAYLNRAYRNTIRDVLRDPCVDAEWFNSRRFIVTFSVS